MHNRHRGRTLCVLLLTTCLGLSLACWKTQEQPESGTIDGPTAPPVDLGRDDMVALPGADVDMQLLEQFPHYLRQKSSMATSEIFAVYDRFFSERGWSVETSIDPITQNQVHKYRLGIELAFVTVTEVGPGHNDVELSRRQLREYEISENGTD